MVTISFHFLSLLVGLGIGAAVGMFIALLTLFGERWGVGFSDGWKCGKEYAERKQEVSDGQHDT